MASSISGPGAGQGYPIWGGDENGDPVVIGHSSESPIEIGTVNGEHHWTDNDGGDHTIVTTDDNW